ncbi:hypothetical protein HS088_TW06G00587 [Tripterygium wilfordii]|uniref:Uncharacterized protein n=1 Tax=Tripterygium wilfordii TaxID=458696 RepID=A0A7J7DK18_TRIWF|nr:uncharacterized protein LOC120000848 [Tripterygium wilfordii]KAF5746416.1 hypothetical protein HS088_TW06G00587 [Tripterygium wilfordii]
MKVKKKGGKVFPSASSSSSSSVSGTRGGGERDVLSVLKLLPAAILALVSILCFEDREVLAYMITRSINPSPSILPNKPIKRSNHNNKSKSNPSGGGVKGHKPPVFDCDCFHCYTNYWHRWNFSPNRDLIEEAIEAFEEHLSNDEKSRKSGKRRDKANRRNGEKPLMSPVHETDKPTSPSPTENVLYPITSSETVVTGSAAMVHSPGSTHKGFARKVLPDLLGLLNSRLWSLWNPNG